MRASRTGGLRYHLESGRVTLGESMRILSLLLLVTFAAAAQKQAATPALSSAFAGSNICEGCHADVWMNFYKNPHYKSIASGKEPEDKTGCEGCHGPAEKRVENLGGKETLPRGFSLMSPQQGRGARLRCHVRRLAKENIHRSGHTRDDVAR